MAVEQPLNVSTGSAWRLIRRGPFARLWWAGAVSSLGDWMAFFATLTLAARIGGEHMETAILVPLVGRILPGLVFGAVSGVIADRLDRKKAMITGDVGRAALTLSLAFVGDLRTLFLVSVLLEMLTMLWQPSKEATVPNLVSKDRLVTANSLSLGAAYGTFPVGAAIFALLAKLGTALTTGALGEVFRHPDSFAFLVDSVTFMVAASVISTIPIPRVAAVSGDRRGRRRFDLREPLRDLVEGVRFVASARRVRSVVVGMATALFGGGMVIALGVPFAQRVLGADAAGFGALITALGTGAALGMLSMAVLGGQVLRRDVMFGLAVLVAGASLAAASLMRTVFGALWWMLILGFGSGAAYVMGFTHLHEQVEDRLRGRTFAALLTLVRSGLLAAIGLAGVTAAVLHGRFPEPFHNGTRNVLFLGGAIIFLSGALTLWSLRDLLQRPKLTAEAVRTVRAASEAFTFRGGTVQEESEDAEDEEE